MIAGREELKKDGALSQPSDPVYAEFTGNFCPLGRD